MEFLFTNESAPSQADEILHYLLGPRLWIPSTDYPDAINWLQKAHGELNAGVKRAMVAYHARRVAGVIIYQRDKANQKLLEVKNITVRPDERGRHIASFLLKNVEIEGKIDFPGVEAITIDAKANNKGIKRFLRANKYATAGEVDLYGLGSGTDIIYRKNLNSLRRID